MLPALALLWSAARRPDAAGLWGGVAVLVSHRWLLLGLHPLMWIGACSLEPAGGHGRLAGLCHSGGSTGGRLGPTGALVSAVAMEHGLAHGLPMGVGRSGAGPRSVVLDRSGSSVIPARSAAGRVGPLGRCGRTGRASAPGGWWLWQLTRQPPMQRKGRITLGVGAVVLAHAWGWWSLRPTEAPATAAPTLMRMGLWQPALPTREKFNAAQQQRLPGRLQDALDKAAEKGADGLVAPEGTCLCRKVNCSKQHPCPCSPVDSAGSADNSAVRCSWWTPVNGGLHSA